MLFFVALIPSNYPYPTFLTKPYPIFPKPKLLSGCDTMEVSDLITHTKNTWIDACLELPPNQYDTKNTSWVLLGKLITNKVVGTSIVSNVVNKVWRLVFPIRVSRLENNTFMFHSHHEVDMDNAYRRRPWSIREGHLVLKPWNPSLTWQEISFTSSTFWVQMQGLPKLWRSSNNLRLLGEKAGNVIEVDLTGKAGGS